MSKKDTAIAVLDFETSPLNMQQMMYAAAAAAGCSIEFGGPGPTDLMMSDRMFRGLRTEYRRRLSGVEHTYSPKPLTKRQKRRLRGKQKAQPA